MKITLSIQIAAPVEQVFELFSNLEQIDKRITGITKLDVLEGPAQMAVGTHWRETRVFMGKEATEEMTVTSLEKNKNYVVEAASHGAEYHSMYTFESKDGGTEVNLEFTGKPVSLVAKLMIPLGLLFKGVTKKAFMADMEEIKAFAEKV